MNPSRCSCVNRPLISPFMGEEGRGERERELYPAIDSLLRAASSRIWASEASRACYICLYREKRFLKKLDSHMGKTRN